MSAQDFLTITDRISALPIIHGAGDFAVEVRDRILKLEPDCVAIPLPPSFQDEVEAGVDELPYVSMVSVNEDAHHISEMMKQCLMSHGSRINSQKMIRALKMNCWRIK